MDPSKRKRPATNESTNGGYRRRQRRSSGDERPEETGDADNQTAAVSDAEVEEFYAILQRIMATRRATATASGNGAVKAEAERIRWRPSFVWEDFEGGDGAVKDDGNDGDKEASGEDKKEEKSRVRGLELDLNVDPEPEGGECTAQCVEA